MKPVDRVLLDEQIEYYRARAPEYDEWFFRRGRYDRGEGHRRAWFAEGGLKKCMATCSAVSRRDLTDLRMPLRT